MIGFPSPSAGINKPGLFIRFRSNKNLATDRNNIIAWTDEIQGFKLEQLSPTIRPVIQNTLYGQAIKFTGTQKLARRGRIPLLEGIQDLTIFTVSGGVYNASATGDLGPYSLDVCGGFSYYEVGNNNKITGISGSNFGSSLNDGYIRDGAASSASSPSFGSQIGVRAMVFNGRGSSNTLRCSVYSNNIAKSQTNISTIPNFTFKGTDSVPCELAIGSLGSTVATGIVFEYRVYLKAMDEAERTAVYRELMATYKLAGRRRVICDGDSITLGSGSTNGLGYPKQLELLFGPYSPIIYNIGVGGQTSSQIEVRSSLQTTAAELLAGDIIVFMGGTNDIATSVATATVITRIQTFVQNRVAAGYKVLVHTLLPASGTGNAAYEADRQIVNTAIRANAVGTWGAAGFIDTGASGNGIGDVGDLGGVNYFDGVHPNSLGYAIIAGLTFTAINAVP